MKELILESKKQCGLVCPRNERIYETWPTVSNVCYLTTMILKFQTFQTSRGKSKIKDMTDETIRKIKDAIDEKGVAAST